MTLDTHKVIDIGHPQFWIFEDSDSPDRDVQREYRKRYYTLAEDHDGTTRYKSCEISYSRWLEDKKNGRNCTDADIENENKKDLENKYPLPIHPDHYTEVTHYHY